MSVTNHRGIVDPIQEECDWKREAARFTPHLKLLIHTSKERIRSTDQFNQYDIVLTTCGILRNDATIFADFRFDTCILDESQMAKNAITETAKSCQNHPGRSPTGDVRYNDQNARPLVEPRR